MKKSRFFPVLVLALAGWLLPAPHADAAVLSQCPTQQGGSVLGDLNKDGMIRSVDGEIVLPLQANQVCMHLTAGDGFSSMADDRTYSQYIFGFANVTGTPDNEVAALGILAAQWPAPTIALDQGDSLYLTVTNVGMKMRPDLFDAHSVHYHGLPNSANIFDGLPESGLTINMGASITYYYLLNDPGTYLYHCHVEAAEHMQMGMLGNLYVRPAQNRLPDGTDLKGFTHRSGFKYAYNDGDGSTYYDVEYPIQLEAFDSNFHDASISVQALPFANMKDTYFMINGRGYPDTVNPDPLPPPAENGGIASQTMSSLITATKGQKILLRVNNVDIARLDTIATLGIPMKVVGRDAVLLRSGKTGENLYYTTSVITVGGGECYDIILDTANVAPGTYFLYTTNFYALSNYQEDFGGMMTEIRISN